MQTATSHTLKSKAVRIVQHYDWDEFVEEVYGKIYSFKAQPDKLFTKMQHITVPLEEVEEYKNTEITFEPFPLRFGVRFETWKNTTPEETLKHFEFDYDNDNFWAHGFFPHTQMIANDLYANGLLEAGEYVIVHVDRTYCQNTD